MFFLENPWEFTDCSAPFAVSFAILQMGDGKYATWGEAVRQYGELFHRVIGRAESMAAAAAERGRHWYQGIRAARRLFR